MRPNLNALRPDDRGTGKSIALDFRSDAVVLCAIEPDGEVTDAGAAVIGSDTFGKQIDALRREALVRNPNLAQVRIWLPEEQVIVRDLALSAKTPSARKAEALRAMAAETGYRAEEICLSLAPAAATGGTTVAIALVQTVREALDYARKWGFRDCTVSTRHGGKCFGSLGPAFDLPAGPVRTVGKRALQVAAATLVVLGGGVGALKVYESAPVNEAIGVAKLVAGIKDPVRTTQLDVHFQDHDARADRSLAAGIDRADAQLLALQRRLLPAPSTLPARVGMRYALLDLDGRIDPSWAGAPVFIGPTLPSRPDLALSSDAPLSIAAPSDDGAQRALLLAALQNIRESSVPLATQVEDDDQGTIVLAAVAPAGSLVADVDSQATSERSSGSLFGGDADVAPPAVAAPVGTATRSLSQPPSLDAVHANEPQMPDLRSLQHFAAAAVQMHAPPLRRPIPDDIRSVIPSEPAEQDIAAVAPPNDSIAAPREIDALPLRRPASLVPIADETSDQPGTAESAEDSAPTQYAALQAPAPPARPERLQARATPKAIKKTVRKRSNVPSSVQAAAERRGLVLDQTSLIGVIDANSGRRALIRTASGDYRKVGRGDVLEGWRVTSIGREAIKLTRKGRNRTLLLVSN